VPSTPEIREEFSTTDIVEEHIDIVLVLVVPFPVKIGKRKILNPT
jgi:hypothetical protein